MKNTCIQFSSFLLILCCLTFACLSLQAQTRNYGAVLNFNSACCGTPDGTKIFRYIKGFRTKNKISKIRAIRVSPLGREGEHAFLLKLNELSKKQKVNFMKGLKKVVYTYKTVNPSDGSVDLNENEAIQSWEERISTGKLNIKTITF